MFTSVTDYSYDVIFPALASPGLVASGRWGIAGLLILPQAIVLGATFPLMAAALVRMDTGHPGRAVARAYLLNTLGGAAGVLLAGFWMIGTFGLPGTSVVAAGLNLIAAGLALRCARSDGRTATPAPHPPSPRTAPDATPGAEGRPLFADRPRSMLWMMLAVSFGTASASFTYEIGWTRMLALVLGSATHSFELMLSAFILGLALGAAWIEDRTDRTGDPLRLLGGIQVLMGLAALVSVPLFYLVSFDAMAWLVQTLPGRPAGYALFNLSRYGLCLLVMLPATVLAGMTLPVITGSLLRAGHGEEAIGRVYGTNTIGSVAGAGIAGLVALPLLGVKGLIVAGALLDVLLGLWLLGRSARWSGGGLRWVGVAALGSALLFGGVQFGIRFDEIVLSSGVYRHGNLPRVGERQSLYHQDGVTATVSAYIGSEDGVTVLATNGKPDASLEPLWRMERRDTLPERPIAAGRDFTTQVLAPMIALAHRPDARTVANIGHGSGMTATALLTSEAIERVVTIEIEPLMVEASVVFLPANEPAFSDPRASYVFDDAKSYFSYRQDRFDIIFAEPSNPWVSGTSSLFTREFYERARAVLAEGGVLAQWMQIYELNDDLFLSVVAALDAVFPSYRAYQVGDSDIAIVARADGALEDPDWSVLNAQRFVGMTAGIPRFRAEHMQALLLFDETTFRAVLDQGVRPNSDYRPLLDLGAERTRFEHSLAEGTHSFATSRVDIARLLREDSADPVAFRMVPSYGLASAVSWGRAAWLREANAAGGGIAPAEFPDWQESLVALQTFMVVTRTEGQLGSWEPWAASFDRAEAELHWGTIGWTDTTFYREVYDFLDRADAPAVARAAVDVRHGLSLLEWDRVAAAADLLVPRVALGEAWLRADTLLDIAVLAYLREGRPAAARNALDLLRPRVGRDSGNLRDRLLEALVARAGA